MSATVRVLCPPTRSADGAWSHTSAARPLGFTGSRARPLSSGAKSASPPAGAVTRATGGGGGEGVGGAALVSSAAGVGAARAALLRSLQGTNRGIFGIESGRRSEIEGLLRLLESRNPTLDPIEQVGGCWRLLYSTVTILGSRRTKLGLRDLVSLGDFFQKIDLVRRKAINEIRFSVRGLKMAEGQLTVVASFSVASRTRVDIRFERSDISPVQLMNLFRKNYELLLAIFNPEGWLEITYVDESIRIGRDDRGNVFVLERLGEEAI